MARKSGADVAKEKAAKQKKIAIGLSVVLVLAMGYAVKTMMSLNSGGAKPVAADTSTTTVPSTSTTPVTTTPAVTPTATPTGTPSLAAPSLAGSTTTPTTDPQSGAPTTSGSLVPAVIPTAGVGQLQSFSEFQSKDPFLKPATPAASPAKSGGTKKPATTTPPPSGTGTKGSGVMTPPAAPPTSAVISVNGTAESVAAGASFPASSPLFQLLSLTKNTAKVTVIGGSYASGAAALTLTANKSVTLVNTADGTRYTLLLFPQGTAAPAAPTANTASPATTPTTTTTG